MCQSIQTIYKFCGCPGEAYQQICPNPTATCKLLLRHPTKLQLTCYCEKHSSQTFKTVRQDRRDSALVTKEYNKIIAREERQKKQQQQQQQPPPPPPKDDHAFHRGRSPPRPSQLNPNQPPPAAPAANAAFKLESAKRRSSSRIAKPPSARRSGRWQRSGPGSGRWRHMGGNGAIGR